LRVTVCKVDQDILDNVVNLNDHIGSNIFKVHDIPKDRIVLDAKSCLSKDRMYIQHYVF